MYFAYAYTYFYSYIHMCVCAKNLFYFLHNAVTCLQTTLSHRWSLPRSHVLNWPVTFLVHRAVTWKMLCSHGFCGSLRIQTPIPPFLLLTYLHYQGAAYFNIYIFINFYSLQACSLSKDPCDAGTLFTKNFRLSVLAGTDPQENTTFDMRPWKRLPKLNDKTEIMSV